MIKSFVHGQFLLNLCKDKGDSASHGHRLQSRSGVQVNDINYCPKSKVSALVKTIVPTYLGHILSLIFKSYPKSYGQEKKTTQIM